MQTLRTYRGPAIFSFGFRPFFLAGAVWAAIAVPIWLFAFTVGAGSVGGMAGRDWHVHEMLFGFLPAVVAGFLLTAVPNWTGRMPVTGPGLAALVGLWAAGRVAMLLTAALGWGSAVIDSAFLVAFAFVIWREVLAGKNLRNLPVCAMISLLALANIAFHLRLVWPAMAGAPERLALAVAVLLISLIGGRIIPSFTRNWLAQRRMTPEPIPFNAFDKVTLAVTGAAVAGWVAVSDHPIVGALLILAGLLGFLRLCRWCGARAMAEPLVWILHLGYLWLVLGLGLLGASMLWSVVPRSSGVHALTAGAIGVMILAVMTRATLGHTGRPRRADRPTLVIYLLINLAAVLRVLAPFSATAMVPLLIVSGLLWSAAFTGFALVYGPMLARTRRGAG